MLSAMARRSLAERQVRRATVRLSLSALGGAGRLGGFQLVHHEETARNLSLRSL